MATNGAVTIRTNNAGKAKIPATMIFNMSDDVDDDENVDDDVDDDDWITRTKKEKNERPTVFFYQTPKTKSTTTTTTTRKPGTKKMTIFTLGSTGTCCMLQAGEVS